jgi:predicted dehydrogenase
VRLERYDGSPARVELPGLPALDRLGVLREFRRAVETGDTPECSAADNLRTLGALFALAHSVEQGRPVRIEELAVT